MSREKSITKAFSFKLDRLTRKMRRFSKVSLNQGEADITIDQWGILRLLFEHDEPMNQTQIAELVIKDTPSTSRILDLLCKKQLAERKPNKNDRRKFDIVLTKKGSQTVRKVSPIVDTIRKDIFRGLSKRDFEELDRIISKIERNLEN